MTLPIKPGDTIWFVWTDNATIEHELCDSVGVDIDGRLFARCGDYEWEIGTKEQAFMSLEDAHLFIDGKLPADYGTVDINKLEWENELRLGTTIYGYEYDSWEKRWYIFENEILHIMFDEDGTVRITEDGGVEYTVGKDPIFLTHEEAWEYVKKHPKGI